MTVWNSDFSFPYDCEQEKIAFWNNGSRLSDSLLAKIYVQPKQKEDDRLSNQDNSVFCKCLRDRHQDCNGFLTTDEYKIRCSCICHSVSDGLSNAVVTTQRS